jgi:predicted O-methyltransferase YrrM
MPLPQIDIPLGDFISTDLPLQNGDMPPCDLLIVLSLIAPLSPEVIYEIGTFRGVTAQTLAVNFPSATIFTADLPKGSKPLLLGSWGDDSLINAAPKIHSASNIQQLSTDSSFLKYHSYFVDVVLIDAGHSYEQVIVDTVLALRHLSPTGMIIWHDYTEWEGVTRALDYLNQSISITHVAGSHVAFYRRSNG